MDHKTLSKRAYLISDNLRSIYLKPNPLKYRYLSRENAPIQIDNTPIPASKSVSHLGFHYKVTGLKCHTQFKEI